jgi:hypothetical protein
MIPGSASTEFFGAAGAAAAGGGAYEISRSLRFNSGDSAYLNRTFGSSGNRKTWTWAGWFKRSGLGAARYFFSSVNSATQQRFQISDDKLYWVWAQGTAALGTAAVFRDPSAWYHIQLVSDTDNATPANRIRVYVNGVSQSLSGDTVSSGEQWDINTTIQHRIGSFSDGGGFASYLDGYLADIHFIDGQALDPSSFTTTDLTTGQLLPVAYTGSYGTNGFKLDFSSNATTAALGTDTSGNSNTWTVNNFSVTAGVNNDSLTDTPTSYGTDTGVGGEVRGNYATWNPLYANGTLSNGNLDVSTTTTNSTTGTIFASSGKWYWETTVTTSNFNRIGIVNLAGAGQNLGGTANSWAILHDGQVYTNSSTAAYGPSYGVNDLISIALDIDAGKIWYGKNGTWMASGNPATGANPSQTFTAGQTMAPAVASGSGTCAYVLNAGQRAFAYTAPSGFKALVDTNLPAPVVAKPNTVMDAVLWTGNNTARTISGLNFSPDLVWIKNRSTAQSHTLYDTIRGATKALIPNGTDSELTLTNFLTAFTSDGFSIGTDNNPNGSGNGVVGWTWDAGTSTVTNTAGSITSQVRANPSAGFSVVTYTGSGSTASTVGHGLGVTPGMVILKNRTGTGYQWRVWHSYFGVSGTKTLLLSDTSGEITGSTDGYITGLTSTVFGFGGGTTSVNASSIDYVAYCWAPVSGYSSFGSYVGNGSSSDGPFVYTGHKSRWLMIKKSSNAGSWIIWDSVRDTYNYFQYKLGANLASSENDPGTIGYTYQETLDSCSNGFKIRSTSQFTNTSGETYIFASFAENPFQYARAR